MRADGAQSHGVDARSRSSHHPARRVALLVLAVGWLGAAAIARWHARNNQAFAEARLRGEAEQLSARLTDAARSYQYGLRGARGAVITAGAERIDRAAFQRYARSRDPAREFPGASAFGYVRRVAPSEQASFIEAQRAHGEPTYSPQTSGPPTGEAWLVQLVEPSAPNHGLLGLDFASQPGLRAAAQSARRSGLAALSEPILEARADAAEGAQLFMLLPVFPAGVAPSAEADRERAAVGWTFVRISVSRMVEQLAGASARLGIALRDEGVGKQLWAAPAAPAATPALRVTLERQLLGRRWQIEVWGRPRFVTELHQVSERLVFVVAAFTASLLASLAYAYAWSRHRTRSLQLQQGQLSAIIEHASDAFVGVALDGKIVSWNAAAEQLLGVAAGRALGSTVTELQLDGALHAMPEHLKQLHHGLPIAPYDATLTHADGTAFYGSIAGWPVFASDGQVTGVAYALRNIDALKKAARERDAFTAQLEHDIGERTAQLEAARRDLQAILDAVPSMIGYWDANQRNRFANRAYHAWFGADPGTLPGKHLRELLGPDLYLRNLPYVEAALAGVTQSFERTLTPPGAGEPRHALAHYLPDVVDGAVRGFYVLVHDVTELHENRRKLAAATRENEALLATLHKFAKISVSDGSGRIIQVNDSFCALSGYPRQELLGQDHVLLRSGVHPPEFWAEMWRTLNSGETWRGEICNRSKSGRLYWVDTVIAPFVDGAGKLERYVSIRIDVTARKTAASELARERERLDNILRGTNAGTWEWNVQTGETRFNERWANMIGYSLSELGLTTIETWRAHAHPDDLAESERPLQAHFAGTLEFYECECRMRHRDGHWIWVLDRGRVSSWTPEGKPDWMFGTRQDITTSKEALRRLAASEAFLERAGRVAGVGGWQLEIASGELTWTSETRRIHEVPDDYEPSVERGLSFYPDEIRATLEQAIQRALAEGIPWDLEVPFRSARGRERWVRAVGEAELKQGNPVRLIGALQDITARREADVALRSAIQHAQAASAAKSEFLANMSHEIRTPLNAVIGMSYLLQQTAISETQRRYLTQIQSSGRALLSVINDVLDVSKIEAGEMVIEDQPFELARLLQEVDEILRPSATAKELELRFELPEPTVLRWYRGDAARVRQILINLVGNALKFTERGSVVVSADSSPQGRERTQLCFRVTDTGIGIAAGAKEQLFNAFTQADASTTRRFGGTGLGLSIVRRLVGLMGGEVGVESELGRGSEFWFSLPLRLVEPPTGQDARSALSVVLVSDIPLTRNALQATARQLGWGMDVVDSGERLLERLRATPEPPEAVVLALRQRSVVVMEALLQLRRELGPARMPALVVVRDDDQPEDELRTHLDATSLRSPISASSFFNAVNEALVKRGGDLGRVADASRLDDPSMRWLTGVRVLVVDDSDVNREVATHIVEHEGAEVAEAPSGSHALRLLNEQPFDVVLMDIQMPGIDGHETTRRIRAQAAFTGLPVVAMTAGALVSERQRALAAGMDDFVTKPLDPQLLTRVVRRYAERSLGRSLVVEPRTRPANDALADWPTIEGIDKELAQRQFNGDAPLFSSLLRRFLTEFGELGDSLTPEPAPEARLALARRMHKLAGSSATLGALRVHEHAAALETLLHDTDTIDASLQPHLQALQRALTRLAEHARPVLEADPGSLPPGSPAVDIGRVQALAELLRAQDLAAIRDFQEQAAALQHALGMPNFQRLQQAIHELEFERAAALLCDALQLAS